MVEKQINNKHLPKTGENNPISYYIIGIFMALIGTLLILSRKINLF